MFHHDAHLRLNACDGLRSVRRAEAAGVRARPRNTDANSLFEKIGLADRVRKMIHDPAQWEGLPDPVREWFEIQKLKSEIPPPDHLLVETFPRGDRHYLVCYPFEGRLAHQTLGMLLTRRLERMGAKPTGFVASEYAMAVWGMEDMSEVDMDALFHPDMMGDDLESWLDESALMKRTFGHCAQISGLILSGWVLGPSVF